MSHQSNLIFSTDLGNFYSVNPVEAGRQLGRTGHLRAQLLIASLDPPLKLDMRTLKRRTELFSERLAWLTSQYDELVAEGGSMILTFAMSGLQGGSDRLKRLLGFVDSLGLHLCQEFVCISTHANEPRQNGHNRICDSSYRAWWLSKHDRPKADNRRVLVPYSESMKSLLREGDYRGGRRPSEHVVGATSFLSNNGGAIPPNVLVVPRADDREFDAGMSNRGLTSTIAEFFISYLTEPGDRILAVFSGSISTCVAAERTGRCWAGFDLDNSSDCLKLFETGISKHLTR